MKILMIILIRVDEKKACSSGNCWMRLVESKSILLRIYLPLGDEGKSY